MKPFTLRDVLNAVQGRFLGEDGALDAPVLQVTSDSRTVGPGSLFIALRGTRVDGHVFMADCLAKGAVACVTEREPSEGVRPAILVDSTVRAVGALAAWYRGQFDIPVIGITGSVGKTTTKEMIAAVLSARFSTHKTQKNQNNELGVPWTIMRLEQGHQVSVVEMGISDFGEMRRLTRIVRPTIAVLSVIGDAHLEFLGDRAGVLRAKSEIFEGMDRNCLAVLNGDDELLRGCRPDMRRATYGLSEGCDIRGRDIQDLGESGVSLTICHAGGSFDALIPAFGRHIVYAALAAAAVGLELGMTGEEIASGISNFRTVGDRARVVHTDALTVVSDCYNANPNSCRAALDALTRLEAGRRICILGDMLELGPSTAQLHREVGGYAARRGIDLILGCGGLSAHTVSGALEAGGHALHFRDKAALLAELDGIVRPGDCVLVKASRGMAFEEIVDRLTGMR